jgi:hypothetical protein
MLHRTGKSSSTLDEIRPKNWTVEMTDELLQVLWIIERSLAMAPELSANLDRNIQSPLFTAAELPEPEEAERESPSEAHPDQVPLDLTAAK